MLKSIFNYIRTATDNWINFFRDYELSQDDIENLDGVVSIAKKAIDNKFHQELYARAVRGNKQCLDILLKDADCRLMDAGELDLGDLLVVDFRTDLSTANAVRKLSSHVPMDLWNWKTGTKIVMRTWVLMMVFSNELGEAVSQTYDSTFTVIKDRTLIG